MPARTKARQAAESLRKTLKQQGRNVTWLAEETGYSRSYVSNVLHARSPWTETFARKAMEALAAGAKVTVTWRGKAIQIPENIYQGAAGLPPIAVESAYEEAWKRAWLAENSATTLAVAADRAFQLAAPVLAA